MMTASTSNVCFHSPSHQRPGRPTRRKARRQTSASKKPDHSRSPAGSASAPPGSELAAQRHRGEKKGCCYHRGVGRDRGVLVNCQRQQPEKHRQFPTERHQLHGPGEHDRRDQCIRQSSQIEQRQRPRPQPPSGGTCGK